MLDVPAQMGRTFTRRDLSQGCTVVLAHTSWQNHLGGQTDIVAGRHRFVWCIGSIGDATHSGDRHSNGSWGSGERCDSLGYEGGDAARRDRESGAGLIAASLLTHFLQNLLYGVSPEDPLVFGSVSLTLILAAALAAYILARRATRVNPIDSLRAE